MGVAGGVQPAIERGDGDADLRPVDPGQGRNVVGDPAAADLGTDPVENAGDGVIQCHGPSPGAIGGSLA